MEHLRKETDYLSQFDMKIYGDVFPDDSDKFPDTAQGALSMMRNMKQLVQKCNDGKGKPLSYLMFPLSSPAFQNYHVAVTKLTGRTVRNLQEEGIIQVLSLIHI